MLRDELAKWAASADVLMAANGGADRLLEAGHTAHVIVGDMDGASERAVAASPTDEVADQDSTDCDKLLARAADDGHDALTLMGVEGDRADHVLATYASAARASIAVRLVLRRKAAWPVLPGRPVFANAPAGASVSLLPFGACEGVDLSGVRWALQEARLDPLGRVSISNVATGGEVRAALRTGVAMLFVERTSGEAPWW